MQRRTGFFLIFFVGVIVGLFVASLNIPNLPSLALVLDVIIIVGMVLLFVFRRRRAKPTYDDVAEELFADINDDVQAIRGFVYNIKNWQLRQQLDLICEDIMVLMDKVAIKAPESRLTAGKFIRGYLDFIINDILPQYIDMQNTPRYYEASEDKMEDGYQAIRTFGTFLHKRIVELEIADDMRYAVAIEMLKSLNAYTNGETEDQAQSR